MKNARFSRLTACTGATLVLTFLAPFASAQTVQPPKVEDVSSGNTILAYLIGIVLAAAAVGLAAMPSRREHQD